MLYTSAEHLPYLSGRVQIVAADGFKIRLQMGDKGVN